MALGMVAHGLMASGIRVHGNMVTSIKVHGNGVLGKVDCFTRAHRLRVGLSIKGNW